MRMMADLLLHMCTTYMTMDRYADLEPKYGLDDNQWLFGLRGNSKLCAIMTLNSSGIMVQSITFSFCAERLQLALMHKLGFELQAASMEASGLKLVPDELNSKSFVISADSQATIVHLFEAAQQVLYEVEQGVIVVTPQELAASLPQLGPKPDQLAGAFNPDDDDAPLSDELISQLKDDDSELDITATEAPRVVRERIGQQRYRKGLEELWEHQCAVTSVREPILLRASHAMPWAECKSGADRLSPYNGFLLNVALDALFDKFLISFDEQGTIMLAPSLKLDELKDIGITKELKLRKLLPQHERFLNYHRERFLAKQNEAQDTAKTGAGDTAME